MVSLGAYFFFSALHKHNLEASSKDKSQQVRKVRTAQCLNFSRL